jgi:hypothetical protein
MYSDEEDDFSSPDEGSDSEPMLGKCGNPEQRCGTVAIFYGSGFDF